MPETIVKNDYITMVYRSDIDAIHHTIHRAIAGDNLRNALNAGADVLAERGAYKWLSDDRRYPNVSPEDGEWSMLNWGPRTASAGWKYWALVVPEEISGRVDMSGIVEGFYNLGVTINVFTTVEEAEDWLAEQ